MGLQNKGTCNEQLFCYTEVQRAEYHYSGVVWHTGKVLTCGAVGPRFKPRQGRGDFVGPILF